MTITEHTTTDMLAAARDAYDADMCVVKVRTDGSKYPDGKWKQYQTERPPWAIVERWFRNGHPGIGYVCGDVSGGLEMIEFEGRFRTDNNMLLLKDRLTEAGVASLFNRLLHGYSVWSPSGGLHMYARIIDGLVPPNTKIARREATAEELADDPRTTIKTLIETRGEGGFVVAEPSHGSTHPNGRPWVVKFGGPATIPTLTTAERQSLIAVFATFDEAPPPPPPPPPGSDRRTTPPPYNGAKIGESWFDAVVAHLETTDSARSVLERHGWVWQYDDRHGRQLMCRPGKDAGVSGSINGNGRFVNFSSSVPFDAHNGTSRPTSYDALDIIAVYEYRGDRMAAARDIAERTGILRRWQVEQDDQIPTFDDDDGDDEDPPNGREDRRHGKRQIALTPASTIHPRPVKWLWQQRIALGTLALIGGREGIGKSITAYQLAADITCGRLPGVHYGTPRAVLICATEDSWEHTIVPRLMAAGADLELVYRIDVTTSEGVAGTLTLPTDLSVLEDAVAQVDAAAIILDPLLSRLANNLDTHKDAEVRVALEPLVAVADRTGAALIGLIHVNKSTTVDPLTMLMASRAFAAVARAVLFVAVDPNDETGRLRYLGQPKNNLGTTDLPLLSFTIESTKVADTDEGDVWTGRLEWQGEDPRSIADVLRSATEPATERSDVDEAAGWLQDYLTIHHVAMSETIKAAAKEYGHKERTLHRARERIGAGSTGYGFPRHTWWSRPGMTPDEVTTWLDAQPEQPQS